MVLLGGPNQRWSLDFVSDAFTDSRRIRILTIVDDRTRKNLALIADTSLSGLRVARELDRIIVERRMPGTFVSDNGTEFTSMSIFNWVQNTGIDWHYNSVNVDVEGTRSIRQAEVGSVRTMLDRIKEQHGIDPEQLIADSAYGSGPMLGWLVDRDISPHIPVLDKAGRTDGTWSRTDFEWDPENNQYICPEGEPLNQFRRNYSDANRGPSGKGVAKYQALMHACQTCPSNMKCCPKADARKITRQEHEDARQLARDIAKTRQYAISMQLRKKVEMLFAQLKRILGLGRLRLRGPCGANDEFLLAATAQNLRKLAKTFSAPQQTRKA